MGMFDRVWTNCPQCGAKVEFQSKAGECALVDYDIDNVPITIAESLDGNVQGCRECGNLVKISLSSYIPQTIRMTTS